MPDEAENDGGGGGGVTLSRRDLAILRKCADRFPFVDDERREIVDWVMKVGRDAKSPRTKLSAAKTAAALERINLQETLVWLQSKKQQDAPAGVSVNVNVGVGVQISTEDAKAMTALTPEERIQRFRQLASGKE